MSETEFKTIIKNSLNRNLEKAEQSHAKDVLEARHIINNMLIQMDKSLAEKSEMETTQIIGNISKLMQMLIKLVELERDINGISPIKKNSPDDENEEFTEEDMEIIKRYAKRKFTEEKITTKKDNKK